MFQIGLLEPVPTLHGKFCNLFLRICDILQNAICYYWTKRYSSRGQWETLHGPSAYSEIWRQIIIWVPHSNCSVIKTSNERYGQVISPNLAFKIGLCQGELGDVLRGDIWKIIIIGRCLLATIILSIICSDKAKIGQQIVGPNLRCFGFLLCSICSWMQCARQLSRYVRLWAASLKYFLCFHQWVITREGISRPERTQTSPRCNGFNVGCVLSAGELTCAEFFHSHFCTLSGFTTPLASQNARNTPIVNSYWMFSVEKCVLTEGVSNVSRRIPHLNRNIQDTFHLCHTRMISPNFVVVHSDKNVDRGRMFTYRHFACLIANR